MGFLRMVWRNWFKDLVVIGCLYEVAAIATRRFPTLTTLQKRYRFLGPVIIIGLVVHFYRQDIEALAEQRRALLESGRRVNWIPSSER